MNIFPKQLDVIEKALADGDVAAALEVCADLREGRATAKEIENAEIEHTTDEVEIESTGTASHTNEGGYWMQAWAWVPSLD